MGERSLHVVHPYVQWHRGWFPTKYWEGSLICIYLHLIYFRLEGLRGFIDLYILTFNILLFGGRGCSYRHCPSVGDGSPQVLLPKLIWEVICACREDLYDSGKARAFWSTVHLAGGVACDAPKLKHRLHLWQLLLLRANYIPFLYCVGCV